MLNFIEQKLEDVKSKNYLRELRSIGENTSFCSNDYFNMTQNESVKKEAIFAVEKFGAGAGASRLISENYFLYNELEITLAKAKNTQSSLVFGSGYLANIGVISALADKNTLIIADKLIHASMLDGAKLSFAKMMRFRHNNMEHIQTLLQKYRDNYRRCLILTETIFGMDGDIAPIDNLLKLADNFDAILISDDAHGFGFTTPYSANNHIQIGTLSKGIGSYGGYVCASHKIIEYLINFARSFIYSTGLPPANIASANQAIKLILSDSALQQKPIENANYFRKLMGLDSINSPVVPIIIGDADSVINISNYLKYNNINVVAIRYPTVPKGTSRLRFTFNISHKIKEIERAAQLIKKWKNGI